MSEMQNNRRHQAQKELGLDNTEEELQIEQSIQKEDSSNGKAVAAHGNRTVFIL